MYHKKYSSVLSCIAKITQVKFFYRSKKKKT